jgi:hypothetical protein
MHELSRGSQVGGEAVQTGLVGHIEPVVEEDVRKEAGHIDLDAVDWADTGLNSLEPLDGEKEAVRFDFDSSG